MRNILLTIAYDGTGFSGWQRQGEVRTVQGELERALSVLFKEPVEIAGCSRTDAGVHALGQRATLIAPDGGIPTERIARAASELLMGGQHSAKAGDVIVLSAEEKPEGFHARFSCRGKRYEYRIITEGRGSLLPESVFLRNYAYFVREELDVEAMRRAAEYLIGTHDFKSFEASGGTPRASTVRTISNLVLSEAPLPGEGLDPGRRDIRISVEGDGFLYNMVRIVAGTLVDVGRGKLSAASLGGIIEARDRARAGHTAPPQGLTLAEIFY